jgi:signal transduction histidine kinase
MFLGEQIRFARQNMRMFEQSYRMRQENTDLLAKLSRESELLTQARDAAVQANLAKSHFLAAASHDLRQPMQSLSLNSGALARMPLEGECRQIAQEMSAGIEALRQMLDGLLDISQIDAGAVKPQLLQLPLAVLLDGLCARFRTAAQAKGLRLTSEVAPGLEVISDVALLQRIVSNLLDNAIKYTERGEIRVHALQRSYYVLLSITDTGCGIAPSNQARIFDDLVQLRNPQRDRSKGHGLGLGIVSRLCRLLDIDCTVTPNQGVGTNFTLRLPVAQRTESVGVAGVARGPSVTGRRIMVLDDDQSVRSAYAHALRGRGCQVSCAATLAEALDQVVTDRPDVALVDYRLGEGSDGLQAIVQLRQRLSCLAAILVSADQGEAMRREADRLGVPCLRKPITDEALTHAIDSVLRRSACAGRTLRQAKGGAEGRGR